VSSPRHSDTRSRLTLVTGLSNFFSLLFIPPRHFWIKDEREERRPPEANMYQCVCVCVCVCLLGLLPLDQMICVQQCVCRPQICTSHTKWLYVEATRQSSPDARWKRQGLTKIDMHCHCPTYQPASVKEYGRHPWSPQSMSEKIRSQFMKKAMRGTRNKDLFIACSQELVSPGALENIDVNIQEWHSWCFSTDWWNLSVWCFSAVGASLLCVVIA